MTATCGVPPRCSSHTSQTLPDLNPEFLIGSCSFMYSIDWFFNEVLEHSIVFSLVSKAAPVSKFKFSPRPEIVIFNGNQFYNTYKDSEFLHSSVNIECILHQGYELRKSLKNIKPGELIDLKGMWLAPNTPLLIKNTGPRVEVGDLEFTQNRLKGLTAAFVYDNRHKFPNIKAEEAIILRLTWDNENAEKCKLYLSAVTGAEHFEQFSYWPLICALRKLQLKKIDEKTVMKIAKKNSNGIPMAALLKQNYEEVKRLWKYFPEAPDFETSVGLTVMSTELIDLFLKD
ncbi:LOW QUALITY PROTEIN: uncharacterized protein ACR2FA_000274 [Aphomia sociella]